MSRRTWLWLGALQLALVGAYLLVEGQRGEAPRFAWEALEEPAPELRPLRDGRPVAPPDTPHLVHFWATWCAPCIEELPALLAASEAVGIPLLAVTDEPWPVVERHFGGAVPGAVVTSPDALQRFGVSALPDTFVVRDGELVARMGGARDWSDRRARRQLRAWAAPHTPGAGGLAGTRGCQLQQ